MLIAYFVSQGNNRHSVYRKPKSNKKLDIEITSAIYGIAGNPKKQMDVSKTKTIAENGLVSFYEYSFPRLTDYSGSAKATKLPPRGRPDFPPPAEITTYCRPFTM